MKIEIEWQSPIQITQHKKLLFNKDEIPIEVENRPGVYFFSRVHGNNIEPFYIGCSIDVRARLRTHFGSVKIMEVLRETEEAKTIGKGVRWFSYGYIAPGKGHRDIDAVLKLAERYLIRKALADNYTLINDKGTKFKTHNILFSGSSYERRVFGRSAEIPVK